MWQAAGVSILYKYSHLFGSDTLVTFVSKPHSKCTIAERCGPFQQLAPFEYNIDVYWLDGAPFQLSHVPSLSMDKHELIN